MPVPRTSTTIPAVAMLALATALSAPVATTSARSHALDADLRATAPQDARARVLDLLKQGKPDEAWKAWEAMPAGAAKLRLGIEVASATKQIARGLTLYDELVASTKAPDPAALKALALGAAADLSTSADTSMRAEACGAALVLDQNFAPCRSVLETMASKGATPRDQALGAYALANAGLRPFPGLFSTLEANLPKDLRLRFAQSLTRLPSAERLSFLQPLINDRDMSTQYQTMLTLAGVPGPEVTAALRTANPQGPAKLGWQVAMARHGDEASVKALADMVQHLGGFEKIQIGRALTEALDKRGIEILEEMAKSSFDLERLSAASALARINPDLAFRIVSEALRSGSVAVQPSALQVAGLVRMGTDATVYKKLVGDPTLVSGAIRAIADTLVPVDPQPRPGGRGTAPGLDAARP